jgi:anti-anti-sigma factor
MTFSLEKDSDDRSFRLMGELDLASSDQLIEQVEPALNGEGDIRLDVAGLRFMDSCGIRALIVLCKSLGDRGKVILESPGGEVAKVLDLIRADRFPNLLIQAHRDARGLGIGKAGSALEFETG